MAILQGYNPGPWAERELKNITRPNSAELSRARYYDTAATGYMPVGGVGLGPRMRGPFKTGTSRPGWVCKNFANDFYNRIHMTPTRIDAGLIASDVTYEVLFFNAFVGQSATISAITAAVPDGLKFDLVTPYTLPSLVDVTIRVTFLAVGPPTQDCDVVFSNNLQDKVLAVTGSRLVDFDYEPDWGTGVELIMGYNTVITPRGRQREQRRPLSNYPEWQLRFSLWYTGAKARQLNAVFKAGLNRMYTLPVYPAGVRVLAILDQRRVQLSDISANWWWVRQAQMVTLIDLQSGRRQMLNILTLNADSGIVTFAEDIKLDTAYAAYPAMQAYYTAVNAKQVTTNLFSYTVTFKLYASGSEPLRNLPPAPTAWPLNFNWANGISQQPEVTRAVAQTPGGVESITPLITYPLTYFSGGLTVLSRTQEFALYDFFAGVKGSYKAFKYYDPASVFVTASVTLRDATIIRVKGDGLNVLNAKTPVTLYLQGQGYNNLKLLATTTITRDDGDSDIYLAAPCPQEIPVGAELGLVYTVRLDDDKLQLSYKAAGRATTNIRFKEVME